MAQRAGDREFMTHWLAGSLGADEHIVADVRGFTGPSRYWELGAGLLLTVLSGVSAWDVYFYGPAIGRPALVLAMLLSAAGLGLTLASAAVRKIIFVAVTEQQVIVVQMRSRWRRARVLIAVPIGTLQLATTDRLYRRTISWTAADGGALRIGGRYSARLRLTALGRRCRFDEVLGAIRAQGGLVDLPPLPPVPALDRPA